MWGSPPHTRGTPLFTASIISTIRITPAYAGNTLSIADFIRNAWDHPRIRGEHSTTSFFSSPAKGSPPHTRGTHYTKKETHLTIGITPAYAGNTITLRRLRLKVWDHPRIRGEHSNTAAVGQLNAGSPPHTRGTPSHESRVYKKEGITPAYAGNTPPSSTGRP